MKNLCAMVEISVEDFNRAKKFYESILGIKITEMNVLDTQIGMFPMEGYLNWGCISKCDRHRPSKDGTLIYLNADSDVDGMLEKVKSAGLPTDSQEKRVYLCKEHYKQYKKKTKGDQRIEKWRFNVS